VKVGAATGPAAVPPSSGTVAGMGAGASSVSSVDPVLGVGTGAGSSGVSSTNTGSEGLSSGTGAGVNSSPAGSSNTSSSVGSTGEASAGSSSDAGTGSGSGASGVASMMGASSGEGASTGVSSSGALPLVVSSSTSPAAFTTQRRKSVLCCYTVPELNARACYVCIRSLAIFCCAKCALGIPARDAVGLEATQEHFRTRHERQNECREMTYSIPESPSVSRRRCDLQVGTEKRKRSSLRKRTRLHKARA
jgi:hypothetical protein